MTRLKKALIAFAIIVAVGVTGWFLLCVMILLDPNAQSFGELFHDWFVGEEPKIEVYPFDITCINSFTSRAEREDFSCIYEDPNVREGRTIVLYLNKPDYDTLTFAVERLNSFEPHSDEWEAFVDSMKFFNRKILYDNYPLIYQHNLVNEEYISKYLENREGVVFY